MAYQLITYTRQKKLEFKKVENFHEKISSKKKMMKR